MERLPVLPKAHDNGLIYVVLRDGIYKVGFTRDRLKRRIRACGGVLVLTIQVGQRPAMYEAMIHRRFANKRTSGPRFKEEWFALNDEDLDWLRGLAEHNILCNPTDDTTSVQHLPIESTTYSHTYRT